MQTQETALQMEPADTQAAPRLSTEIIEVTTRKLMKTFIELPRKIYSDPSSPYVMPLELHVKMMMGKLGTPQKHFFLAFKNGEPVARLGVKVHTYQGKSSLHFGFYECAKSHKDATFKLFKKAQEMYPDLPMMGPFHFRQEDPYVGVLVQGFQYDPYFLMPYNPPHYQEYLEDAGFKTAMDLFTYDVEGKDGLPQEILDKGQDAMDKHGIVMRPLNRKKLNEEAKIIAGIFNNALQDNWGYEEFDQAQINEMVMLLKMFIDPRVVTFAMKDGKEIGCLVMIPNYNPLIKPSQGRVNPALVWRFLTQKKTMTTIRGYALGVLKKYHGLGVGSALTADMYERGLGVGYDKCEISWILASNHPMNELSKAMGGKQNKVYRIYEKDAIVGKKLH